jgi:L-seryl-tRNA(Ser) seleniumtransferase
VQEIVRSGIDLVTFSGDKLLGGPQAGLLAGTRSAIAACKQHPLMRALRPSKLTLSGLEATLELYRDGRAGEVPALAMLSTPEPTLEARARKLAEQCRAAVGAMQFEPVRVKSAVGGGSLPLCEPWSWAVAASHSRKNADELDALLRHAEPAVIGRIAEGRLLLDVRTVTEHELALIARAFQIENRT